MSPGKPPECHWGKPLIILASNSWPSSGNPVTPVAAATHNPYSSLTDVSNVALQTHVVSRVTQHSKKTTTTGVTTTIPRKQTRNSTYKVGESSRRSKRSKIPALQSDTPVSNCYSSSTPPKSKHPIDRDIIRQNTGIKLFAKRGTDGQTYNLLTGNEVVGLIIGDFDTCVEQRDIVIEKHCEGSSESGESICAWRSFVLAILVDGYTMVEIERLYFHREKESKLRCDKYSNIRQSVAEGNTDLALLGKPVVLSSSFTGGPRYLSACEAPWRIFGFETHYRTPSVRRLSFHLPGEQTVLYDENSDLETVMHKPSVSQSIFEDLIISDAEKRNVCLFYMEQLLRLRGCSLRNWPVMPYPDNRYITEFDNRLIYDETDYNPVELQTEYERLIRRRGDIALNVASSGIASLLMSGGRMVHLRFHIPVNIDETSTCSISSQSDLGALSKNVLKLTKNMRLTVGAWPEDVIEILSSIVDFTYPNILDNINDPSYFNEKVVLVPTNEVVDNINEHLLDKFPGEEIVYLSCNSVDKTECNATIDQSIFSPGFINGLKFFGVPNHRLALKVGVPAMLLRNINQPNGLCNGTRPRVLKLTERTLERRVGEMCFEDLRIVWMEAGSYITYGGSGIKFFLDGPMVDR
nr:hypothetical protein [Tanacetum cinerariifolium]